MAMTVLQGLQALTTGLKLNFGESRLPEENELPVNQAALFRAVTARYPEVLTKNMYTEANSDRPVCKMSKEEKREAFLATFYDMLRAGMWQGRPLYEVCYDHKQPRLWSFALQGTWAVKGDKEKSKLVCLESLIVLHSSSWGLGPLLETVAALLNEDLELYLLWKELEVRAVMSALGRYKQLPTVGVNIRPTEWMQPRIQNIVLEATRMLPGRIAFEVSEYTDDVHFPRLFGTEGTLRARLTRTLLPVLQRMKAAGVSLLADDIKPSSIYRFEDEKARKRGLVLEESHACTSEMCLSEEWLSVFDKVKFSLEWVMHALRLSNDSGDDFAKVPLYKLHLKDSPAYVAAVTDSPLPSTPKEEAEALLKLQEAAKCEFLTAFKLAQEKCACLPVIEATLPSAHIDTWGLEDLAGEQGGVFFEAKFPPQWYFGHID